MGALSLRSAAGPVGMFMPESGWGDCSCLAISLRGPVGVRPRRGRDDRATSLNGISTDGPEAVDERMGSSCSGGVSGVSCRGILAELESSTTDG